MSRKAAIKGKKGGVEEERELPLQAVVLTDPFETRFTPFTLERPRCLLPLANTPLIEYTFEFLANAGVDEVFVYCGAHKKAVDDYLEASKWSTDKRHNVSPFSKVTVMTSQATSIGAAMRDLDDRHVLVNDFILIYGDVISNLPLESALTAHKARREKSDAPIMTIVLREADTLHRTNTHGYRPVFVLDEAKDRCLWYEQIVPGEDKSRVSLNYMEVVKEHRDFDIRTDLIDCGIDIYTPDALAMWNSHFDAEMPRREFLVKVLQDYELTSKTVHTHIVDDHYAARVRNLHSYDSISRDIVARWSYPLCPDSNLLSGQSYTRQKGSIYKEQGVVLARGAVIKRRTVIGEGTSVGDGSEIGDSIIGRDCVIGRNVKIEGGYLWDNVTVGDGTVITRAIIANEAVVGKKCRIEPGALISYSTRIADGTTISGARRVTSVKRRRQSGAGRFEAATFVTEQGATDPAVVGKSGEGFDYKPDQDDPEHNEIEQLANVGLVYKNPTLSLSQASISTIHSDDSDLASSTDMPLITHSATSSFSAGVDDDVLAPRPSDQGQNYHREAVDSIYDSIVRGDKVDDMHVELQSLRLSTNATEHQVRSAAVKGFMKRIAELAAENGKIDPAVKAVVLPYKEILVRAVGDITETARTANQLDLVLSFQQDAAAREDGPNLFVFVLKEMYEAEIVENEAVVGWWEDDKSGKDEKMSAVKAKAKQLVEILLAESSEEEDDGDEDDEDEDDD